MLGEHSDGERTCEKPFYRGGLPHKAEHAGTPEAENRE